MLKAALTSTFIIFLLSSLAAAQEDDRDGGGFAIGLRSTVVIGHMNLSQLNPQFSDLRAESDIRKGAHHSSLYIVKHLKPWLSVGIESVVGNSDEDGATTMDFQGAGPLVQVKYGRKLHVAGGLNLGAVIVDAMTKRDSLDNRVHEGVNYKSSGLYAAPYLGIGYSFDELDAMLFLKPMYVFNLEEKQEIEAFSANYVGISLGWNF